MLTPSQANNKKPRVPLKCRMHSPHVLSETDNDGITSVRLISICVWSLGSRKIGHAFATTIKYQSFIKKENLSANHTSIYGCHVHTTRTYHTHTLISVRKARMSAVILKRQEAPSRFEELWQCVLYGSFDGYCRACHDQLRRIAAGKRASYGWASCACCEFTKQATNDWHHAYNHWERPEGVLRCPLLRCLWCPCSLWTDVGYHVHVIFPDTENDFSYFHYCTNKAPYSHIFQASAYQIFTFFSKK